MKKPAPKAPMRKTARSPKSVDHHVSKRLKVRRTMMGISQTELGNAVGLTFQQIQKYERGANRISAGYLFQFAGVLGCGPEYFYEGLNDDGQTVETPLDAFLRSKPGHDLCRRYLAIDADAQAAVVAFMRSIVRGNSSRTATLRAKQ
jgi:transcriptional regulator with XRE-family HTH domain